MDADPKLALCAACGYDLSGLPVRGNCPECGAYFDRVRGTGLSDNRAEQMQRSDRLLRRLRTIFLALGAVAFMGCGGGLALIANEPARPIWVASVFALVMVLAAVTSYVYEKDE